MESMLLLLATEITVPTPEMKAARQKQKSTKSVPA